MLECHDLCSAGSMYHCGPISEAVKQEAVKKQVVETGSFHVIFLTQSRKISHSTSKRFAMSAWVQNLKIFAMTMR